MPKLTKKFVTSGFVPPSKGQIIFRDSSLQGFALRVTPNCKSYIVEARVNGVVRRITLGKHGALTVQAARKKAKQLLARMASGKDPVAEKTRSRIRGVTLQEVFENYLASRKLTANSRRSYVQMLPRCLGDWLELPVISITREMVVQRHKDLRKTTKQGTSGEAQANMVMRLLGTLLTFAAANYEVDGQPVIVFNPIKRLSQNRLWYQDKRRQQIIPDHKLSDWYREVAALPNQTLTDYLLLLLLTGLRRTEAATLEWTDIDLSSKVLTIRSEVTKNKKEHRLPLSDYLEDLLQRRYQTRDTSPFVFPGKGGRKHMIDSDHAIKGVAQRADCEFTLHDLRRTFLTTAEKIGLPYVVLKKLANHAGKNDTTFGYIVVDVERLRAPMQQITDHFRSLMGC